MGIPGRQGGFAVWRLEYRVQGLGVRVQGLRFGVWGSGFRMLLQDLVWLFQGLFLRFAQGFGFWGDPTPTAAEPRPTYGHL